jgi:hypothetical protein
MDQLVMWRNSRICQQDEKEEEEKTNIIVEEYYLMGYNAK